MNGDVVIKAEGLGKKYVIGHEAQREGYVALRDVLARNAKNFARSARDLLSGRAMVGGDEVEEFWALKDLDFEIRQGEVVGVIGRNGAGKSTLLKVLSRITEPSEGRVTIKGRMASLLEVGTGFHPELTGRENIYLNGAILGMSHAEVRRKFDEIVAFAEVERFLDTPVKRYSSGMYVRLAFAVAAHLEPEILVVDEVLAVGDAEFQKKCLGKMQDVAGQGRTVLFVSHQLGMIAKMCTRGLVLTRGVLTFDGGASEAIDRYIAESATGQRRNLADDPRLADQPAAIVGFEALNLSGRVTNEFAWHEPITAKIEVKLTQRPGGMLLGLAIDNRHGSRVTTWVLSVADALPAGSQRAIMELNIAPEFLAPGGYTFTVALFEPGRVYHQIEGEWPFVIVDSGSQMAAFGDVDYGTVILPASWSLAEAS